MHALNIDEVIEPQVQDVCALEVKVGLQDAGIIAVYLVREAAPIFAEKVLINVLVAHWWGAMTIR